MFKLFRYSVNNGATLTYNVSWRKKQCKSYGMTIEKYSLNKYLGFLTVYPVKKSVKLVNFDYMD